MMGGSGKSQGQLLEEQVLQQLQAQQAASAPTPAAAPPPVVPSALTANAQGETEAQRIKRVQAMRFGIANSLNLRAAATPAGAGLQGQPAPAMALNGNATKSTIGP